jgi:DNA-binding transcriptional ArsR family regulator
MVTSTLSALAEPNRLQIVELLREGPLTVGEIAGRLQIRQPQASKHLRVLKEAGIVEVQPEANRRYYTLRPDAFIALDTWLGTYRDIWEERLDRLEDYLEEMRQNDGEES